MARNILLCHALDEFNREVGVVKTKTYAQDFQYKKRVFPIDPSAIPWIDKKGIAHFFVNINEADGLIRFLEPRRINLDGEPCKTCGSPVPLDLCTKCNGRITIDAVSVRNMVKRKTIDTFWGLDQSHIMIILIMGMLAIGAFGGAFYLLGQNQNLQQQLNKYLPTPEEVKASKQVTNKFILGVLYN